MELMHRLGRFCDMNNLGFSLRGDKNDSDNYILDIHDQDKTWSIKKIFPMDRIGDINFIKDFVRGLVKDFKKRGLIS